MAPASYTTSVGRVDSSTSFTAATAFTLLFEILLVILMLATILVLVRRYLRTRRSRTQIQARSTSVADVEAVHPGVMDKRSWSFWRLSGIPALALWTPRPGSGAVTAALLEADAYETLPSPVLASPRQRGSFPGRVSASLMHRTKSCMARMASVSTYTSIVSHPSTLSYPRCARSHVDLQAPLSAFPWPIPNIVITDCDAEPAEVEPSEWDICSPASTYSEPDSPAVATPPLESFLDLYQPGDVAHDTAGMRPWSADSVLYDGDDEDKSGVPSKGFCMELTGKRSSVNSLGLGLELEDMVTFSPVSSSDVTTKEAGKAEEVVSAIRIVEAAPQVDPTPIREFLQKGVAAIVPSTESKPDCPATHEQDWELAFSRGLGLVGAFSASLSIASLDDDAYDDEHSEPTDYCLDIQKVKAVHVTQVQSAVGVSLPFSVGVEWVDARSVVCPLLPALGSPDDSSDAQSDAGSELSFYSCSDSSFTEEDDLPRCDSDSCSDLDLETEAKDGRLDTLDALNSLCDLETTERYFTVSSSLYSLGGEADVCYGYAV
ncbi:hypothetical protein BD413DRAFT_93821 [Trametes elegans]|nr:hypothetical protein BD413DRAFT_93821 [Trametes elegans]